MINKSFHLIRTNPLLTSNYKLIVTSDYNLYLESFNTNSELSNIKYKHFKIKKTDYLENKIPQFYNGLPVDTAFDVKYDNDNKIFQNKYVNQFDTIYFTGAKYIEDKWYNEEFEYLAPLYIRKNNLPKGFIVLRVDDASNYNLDSTNNYEIGSLNSDNFKDIIDNWKCIKYFDMTYESNLGEWLFLNYINNDRYPKSAFDYQALNTEFSYWNGMDYKTGIYTSKPLYMDEFNSMDNLHFKFEKFITEGYKNNELIYPYILNLKFLFDDTPATPNTLKKYSMNRYYGFYVENLDYVGSLTSYITPELKSNTYLINNIIVSGYTGLTVEQLCILDKDELTSVNPFQTEWDDNKEYYIFIDNTSDFYRTKTVSGLYKIYRNYENNKYVYKIISDEILDQYWTTDHSYIGNIKTININYNNYNIISGLTSDFSIDTYKDCNGDDKNMYADLYLIKIDDKYHVLKYSSGLTVKNKLTINPQTGDFDDYKYYIQTDYAINLNQEYLEYWIVGKNTEYYRKIQIHTSGSTPLTFPIYRLKFSDVKDFDFDRLNTQYSDFDFEKTEYTVTDEEKLLANNYNDNSIPPSKKVGRVGFDGQNKISNISSEYIADDELYEIVEISQEVNYTDNTLEENKIYDLNEIWRKNQSVVKWGFMGSISHSDYPYKLNNNFENGGVFNKTTDVFYNDPNVNFKNLDYFYRIGNFYQGNTGNTIYYKNQTTNIQLDYLTTQISNGFDIESYFGGKYNDLNFDYFTYFFKNKTIYQNDSQLYTKIYDKYSIFNYGDNYTQSQTLFKGIKIKIFQVSNIYTENNNIVKILYGNKTYNDYKFSIILNENYNGIDNGLSNNNGYIDTSENSVNIIMNEKYQNILIIINVKILEDSKLNNLNIFKEKDGLYYGKKLDGSTLNGYNPKTLTASNFINAINDFTNGYGLTVKYYTIREKDNLFYWGNSIMSRSDGVKSGFSTNNPMSNIPDWEYLFPTFILKFELPDKLKVSKNYSILPYYINTIKNDYVANQIIYNNTTNNKMDIYRYSGPYEPIFKDISLFKNGYFCYNNLSAITYSSTGLTSSESTISFQIPHPIYLDWIGFTEICSKNRYKYVECNTYYTSTLENLTKFLCIRGFDFTSIPSDAIINGLTLTISRKSFISKPFLIYAIDNVISLSKNCYKGNELSERSINKAIDSVWSENLESIIYGSDSDLWNYDDRNNPLPSGSNWTGTTLMGSDIKNPLFGAIIQVRVKNDNIDSTILPQIKCVNLSVKYIYNNTTYTADRTVFFDNNYKFDTTLNDFGKINEIIYSKTNDSTDMSKLNKIDKIFPKIDECGYNCTDRFIFKSSWDKEYFIKTENNLKEISGNI